MKDVVRLLILLGFIHQVHGQDSIYSIKTDRPSLTYGAWVVPNKTLQVETGYLNRTEVFSASTLYPDADQKLVCHSFPNTTLRVALSKRVEFRLGWAGYTVTRRKKSDGNIEAGHLEEGLRFGTKILISKGEGEFPVVSLLLQGNSPILPLHKLYPHGADKAELLLLLSKTFGNTSISTNIGWVIQYEDDNFIPIALHLKQGITDRTSVYMEGVIENHYISYRDDFSTIWSVSAGVFYQLNNKNQFDFALGTQLNDVHTSIFAHLGWAFYIGE